MKQLRRNISNSVKIRVKRIKLNKDNNLRRDKLLNLYRSPTLS